MTIEQAKEILKHPKFGDPQQLEALQRLRDAGKEEELRARLWNRFSMEPHCSICLNCASVDEADGKCTRCGCNSFPITRKLLDSWDLDILEAVAEEIEMR